MALPLHSPTPLALPADNKEETVAGDEAEGEAGQAELISLAHGVMTCLAHREVGAEQQEAEAVVAEVSVMMASKRPLG